MNDKLYAEYGNAGHKFPRTTREAFGRDEVLFVATDEPDEDPVDMTNFTYHFALIVYTLAAIVVVMLWWRP